MSGKQMQFQNIFNEENLRYAWKKVRYIYQTEADFIYDLNELAEFEGDLEQNLLDIGTQLENNTYALSALVPLPLPKSANGSEPVSRQNFYVSLRDQVAWTALINVVGPLLDNAMPFWSFGNRLYMPIWREEREHKSEKKKTRFGRYSISSPKLYRNWTSSWPLFRKATSITAKCMLKSESLSEEEQDAQVDNEQAPMSMKIQYWEKDYWKKAGKDDAVYYATIDLSKFYPSIPNSEIFGEFVWSILKDAFSSDDINKLQALVAILTDFHVPEYALELAENEFPQKEGSTYKTNFTGIPTGLFVAGFLANIAMLPIDNAISKKMDSWHRVAQFRFVDDHVFLAYSFDDLVDWMRAYQEILVEQFPAVGFNNDKIQPDEMKNYYMASIDGSEVADIKKIACEKCKLNPIIPSPFTTLTIQKMSDMGKEPFTLMDAGEKEKLVQDIAHILATEFPDEEIRKETRVSWAASMLSRLVPTIQYDIQEIGEASHQMEKAYCLLSADNNEQSARKKDDCETQLQIEAQARTQELDQLLSHAQKKEAVLYKRVFTLLLKALTDNASKPKIWKKLIAFCRATGFDGIELLLDALSNCTLTLPGKKYLFATMLGAMTSNELLAVNIICSRESFKSDRDKAEAYCRRIRDLLKNTLCEQFCIYETDYAKRQLRLLELAVNFSETERLKADATWAFDEDTLCALWYFTKKTHFVFANSPCQSLQKFLGAGATLSTPLQGYQKQLIFMYPQFLTGRMQEIAKEGGRYPLISSHKKETLCAWLAGRREQDCALLVSEYAALQMMKKVLIAVTTYEGEFNNTTFSFTNSEEARVVNYHPENFVLSSVPRKLPHTWQELQAYFSKFTLSYTPTLQDIRFGYQYRKFIGGNDEQRNQVYSLAVLMVCMLTHRNDFPPMLNRNQFPEGNALSLLGLLRDIPVSSYTHAIIVGMLSYHAYEREQFSRLDAFIPGRTSDEDNAPIEIKTLNDLEMHIEAASRTLEQYQLSLENSAPRQLIPVSLINLTHSYNPYQMKGE